MTADLTPEVRDKAALAMHIELNRGMSAGVTAWNGRGTRDKYLAAVDAVAEVLVAHWDPMNLLDANEGLGAAQVRVARALGITEGPYSVDRILERAEVLAAGLLTDTNALRAQLQATAGVAAAEPKSLTWEIHESAMNAAAEANRKVNAMSAIVMVAKALDNYWRSMPASWREASSYAIDEHRDGGLTDQFDALAKAVKEAGDE